MGYQGKGLGNSSRVLTVRMTREQKARLQELARAEGDSAGDVVRMLMMVGELALTDPTGWAESFAAVAGEQVRENLGISPTLPIELRTELLADRIRRVKRSLAGELPIELLA